jgi:hypothetical protein
MRFETIPTWEIWKAASSSFLRIRSSNPNLARIDALIQKYHQVFDMAKLNIMMELKDAVAAWAADKIDRGVATQRLEAMQALEEVVLRKLKEMDGWGKHRYLHVSCLGFEIKTGDVDTVINNAGKTLGYVASDYRGYTLPSAPKKYPHFDDRADIIARSAIMKQAIGLAYDKYRAHSMAAGRNAVEESKRLKLFMAPEFFFRGTYGAYSDIGLLSLIFEKIREVTKDPKYKDWLFILGTALFQTKKTARDDVNHVLGFILDNFALVQKGGIERADGLHNYAVQKEYTSHVDFKRPIDRVGNREPWNNPANRVVLLNNDEEVRAFAPDGSRDLAEKGSKINPSERTGGAIFTMDGITFGIEVCLDHDKQRLSQSDGIQIQLIPSGGMEITYSAVIPGGLVFNVDGSTPHVQIQGNPSPAEIGAPTPVPANAMYFAGDGKIRLYASYPIPWLDVRKDAAAFLKVHPNVLKGVPPPPVPPRPPRVIPLPAPPAKPVPIFSRVNPPPVPPRPVRSPFPPPIPPRPKK